MVDQTISATSLLHHHQNALLQQPPNIIESSPSFGFPGSTLLKVVLDCQYPYPFKLTLAFGQYLAQTSIERTNSDALIITAYVPNMQSRDDSDDCLGRIIPLFLIVTCLISGDSVSWFDAACLF